MIVPLTLLVAAAATTDLRAAPSPLRGRLLVWLGEVSFAFYLVHEIVLIAGIHAVAGAGFFAIALGLAALVHRYVEVPSTAFLTRRSARPRTVPDGLLTVLP